MEFLYILLYFIVGLPISFIATAQDVDLYWSTDPEELAKDFWQFLLCWLILTFMWPFPFMGMVLNKMHDLVPRFGERLLTFLNRHTDGFRLWFARQVLKGMKKNDNRSEILH